MKLRRIWQGLLFTAFAFTGLAANAGLILTLETGDGASASASDDDGDGLVLFNGALGSWLVNVTTGLTNPIIGSDSVDEIDLNSVNVSGGTGTLTITLTRTGLERSPSQWTANLGGTTSGTIDFATLLNGVAISEYSASTAGFSDSDGGQIDELEPYSLSLVATLNHAGANQVSSFDYHVKVPEPSTLALLGSGLLLAGWAGRRRSRQAAR